MIRRGRLTGPVSRIDRVWTGGLSFPGVHLVLFHIVLRRSLRRSKTHCMRFRFLPTVLLMALSGRAFDSPADELLLRAPETERSQLLVLLSGRVVEGQLTPRQGGYDVALPAGRMFVPAEQIRFSADNLRDAYQQLRDSIVELTPNAHLDLARWCLTNRLPTYARREILDALHLDPYRDEARRMLEAVVREEQRAARSVTESTSSYDINDLQSPELLPERRSLGGLPRETARTFTRRIQPLIANKCGNARCHGADRHAFKVVLPRGGSTAYIAEQNLAAILNQLNFADPDQSALLTEVTGLHGGSRDLLFPGRVGGQQLDSLREWVRDVAAELAPAVTARTRNDVAQPMATEVRASATASQTDPAIPPGADGVTSINPRTDRKFLTQAAAAVRHDEFSPDIFNQRYHGQSTGSSGQ